MTKNVKQSTKKLASLASATLRDPVTSAIAKSLAASTLAQAISGKQTGAALEAKAGKVLQSAKYSPRTKTLAASVVAQSNKRRGG